MQTMTTLKKWEDEFFVQTKKVEEPVVRYTGEMAERMVDYVPNRPQFMAEMPTMMQMVEHGLKFEKRLVDEQMMFVRKMMKAMDPMWAKFYMPKPAEKPVARVAPRKAAHKAA